MSEKDVSDTKDATVSVSESENPANPLADSQADSTEDEQGLVAESDRPLDSPRALSPVQSDGQGFQVRGGVQKT